MCRRSPKIVKGITIARAWRLLGKLPCGHVPRLVGCACPPTFCRCEVEIEFCECAADFTATEWDGVAKRLQEFLAAADPGTYADRPIDPEPISTVSRDLRVERYRQRVERGFEVFSPNDIRVDLLKVGEEVHRMRNGAVIADGLDWGDEDDIE